MKLKHSNNNSKKVLICFIIGIIGFLIASLQCSDFNNNNNNGAFVEASFFSKMKSAASKVKSSISSGVNKAKSAVKKSSEKFRGEVKKRVNSVKAAVKRGENSVKSAVKRTGKKIANKFRNEITKAKKVTGKVRTIAGKIKKVSNTGKQFVKKVIKKTGGKFKNVAKKFKQSGKKLGSKFKNSFQKTTRKIKQSKLGKKLKSKVSKARAKLRATGVKLDKLFKKGKKSLVNVRNKFKTSAIKKILKLKKNFGKIKSVKAWKVVSKAFNKAKSTLKGIKQAIKNAKAKDKSQVIKLGSTNKLKPNTKVVKSVTAGDISLASLFSQDAYEKKSDKKLAAQGYKLATSGNENLSVTKVYYNEKDKSLVVSFRGTATLGDWKTNLDVGLKGAYFDGKYAGRVHNGYYKEYMKDREALQKIIKSYEKKGMVANIVFTGHSKGGALGEIAATDYQLTKDSKAPNAKLITFGEPRTGDDKHAEIVNQNIPEFVRVVNTFKKNGKQKQDLVSTVPPKIFGYVHAGTQVEVSCGKNGGVACHKLDTYLPNTEIQ